MFHDPEVEDTTFLSNVGYLPSAITSHPKRLQFLTISFCISIFIVGSKV